MSGGGRNATMPGRLRPISLSGISIMYSGCGRSGPGLRIILSKIFANLSCLTGLKGTPGILARGVCTALRTVVRLALCRESGCGVCRFGSERSLTGRAELVCIFRFVVCGIWSLAVTGRTIRRLPGVVGVQCGPVPGIGDPLRNRPGGAESPPDRFAYVDIYGGYQWAKASLPVELLIMK